MNWVLGNRFGQEADQFALPLGMEVQVDLVDQHDGRLGKRVGALGVALDHSGGEVDNPGDHRPVAVAELP